MRFSRLRLLGFKSFVDATDIPIEDGLTGIVGPNGCGKSNLVEALRFVMGESSYKAMRGSGMDDVIFSGSANRPSRNTAEVTLFADTAGAVSTAALAAGMRRGGLLIALVTLPLYVPTMIFGAATLDAAANGLDWAGPLMLTGSAALFGIATSPFGAAMALRTALD